jgi:hypothetical protein
VRRAEKLRRAFKVQAFNIAADFSHPHGTFADSLRLEQADFDFV